MCGIFSLLNNNDFVFPRQFIDEQFKKGEGRGPDHSILTNVNVKALFGFHRLAINGQNPESNQPIKYNDITLICNGEIYNFRELYKEMNITPATDSDCEVIIHLYLKYGIDHTLQMLDGVFAFILLDGRYNLQINKMYVARDPYGVRPLFWLRDKNTDSESSDQLYGFASELKVLSPFYSKLKQPIVRKHRRLTIMETNLDQNESNHFVLEPFQPGTYATFELPWTVNASWSLTETVKYHSTGFSSNISREPLLISKRTNDDDFLKGIQIHFMAAVFKRCSTTDRPIACLLSGGLDSSLVTALVADYHRINGLPPVETYSIGLEGSEDLKYAKQVADYLGTTHTEIIVLEQDFIDAVPEVIKCIESYDTTTVRASIGNWLLGKYIAANSEAKVIFNGDGADELCGGYLYMHKCPDPIEFDRESRRLLKDIHYFDVLRSDRSISSHGLEPRTPFLDRSWVQYYLSIPPTARFHPLAGKQEKWLLRSAFSGKVFKDSLDRDLLPSEILWRRKEAFSDGVSKGTRSLYQILQEYALTLHLTIENTHHNYPQTAEQRWYRSIFELEYPGLANVIPYFWMPKYVEATDASARTLELY
jgi:asparagine synthase (glutamine-hydrolysing)